MDTQFSTYPTEISTQVNSGISLQWDTELSWQEVDDSDWYETYDEHEDIVEKALARQKDLGQKAANKKARQKASRLNAKRERQQAVHQKHQETAVLPRSDVYDTMEIYKINMQEIAQHAMEAQSYEFERKQSAARMAEVLASIKPARPQTSDETDC
jgi:hypothetical protein